MNPQQCLQQMLTIRAYSGQEQQLALWLLHTLASLGLDRVYLDDSGNVVGILQGSERGLGWLLVSHLDHVHEGELSLWPHPPFEGVCIDGVVYGRGAVDIKGPMVAQLYALHQLVSNHQRPKRDVVFVAFVEEETGGRGASEFLAQLDQLPVQLGAAIVAEPSSNTVKIGHRGIAQVHVQLRGRAHHASLNRTADNPIFVLPEFLQRVRQISLPVHPVLGVSGLTVTQIHTDSASENLTPNVVTVVLDWRFSESLAQMEDILSRLCQDLPATWHIHAATAGFYLAAEHPLVAKLCRYAPQPDVSLWHFATDGRFTHAAGIPTIGFGAGDPFLAHTTAEHIHLSEIEAHSAALAALLLAETPE